MKKVIIILILIVVLGIGYYLISPLFRNIEVNDPLPENIAVVEEQKTSEPELGTLISEIQDEENEDSESDSEYDISEILKELKLPSKISDSTEKQKKIEHNNKVLLQMRARGMRR